MWILCSLDYVLYWYGPCTLGSVPGASIQRLFFFKAMPHWMHVNMSVTLSSALQNPVQRNRMYCAKSCWVSTGISWAGIQENAPIPVTAFGVYGYAWDKNIAYSIPFILCFLTKEGEDSCWSLTHKDQFVDLEIICIVWSVLKWLKAKSQKPDSVVLCMLLEYGNGSYWYCVLSFRKVSWDGK